MEKILEVKEITKIYKQDRGVQDISFDIYKGDIYGFLGPNGAGKTTIMKAITGLVKPYKGSIKLFGHDLFNEFEKAMEKVGAIIETADAYEYMSAYDNLKVASRFYWNIKSTKIDEVLELVGLDKYKREKVSQFSLGMKQRLGFAAALISEPEFVILDEPGNGLDIEGMVDMRNIIKNLAKEKQTTFFISSHLIHEIELTCNKVGIIYDGKLVNEGLVSSIIGDNNSSLEEFFINEVRESRGKGK